MLRIRQLLFMLTFSTALVCTAHEISLEEQAALNLASFPDLTEGILDILYIQIEDLWHKGEYTKIFPVIKVITDIAPGHTEAWKLGGWFLMHAIAPQKEGEEKGKVINDAFIFLKSGIAKNPKEHGLYWEIAWHYYRKDMFVQSLDYLDSALKYGAGFKAVRLQALIYEKIGQKDNAIKSWERILEDYHEMKPVAERFLKKLRGEDADRKDN